MKAAVMTQFREPVEIQSVPDPSPGPDDALIEVKGCSVCRSDWHAWQEDWVWVGIKAEGKITDVIIENMMNWRHSGFHVYCGKAIWPHNEEGLENLARCIIRASFSQERMTYIAAGESANGVAKVIYESKDGKTSKTFDALDWLAQLIAHIPNRGEQMVRYYGFYSNKSRGLRKKAGADDQVPA